MPKYDIELVNEGYKKIQALSSINPFDLPVEELRDDDSRVKNLLHSKSDKYLPENEFDIIVLE